MNTVYGFRLGYAGLVRRHGYEPLKLTPESVSRIHETGGTVLGSSRGLQDPAEMVQTLADLKIGILFAIGGDGTLRGAQKIAEEANRQGMALSVIGIPKTIDKDVSFVQKTSVSRQQLPRRAALFMRPIPRQRLRPTASDW
jgi:6-phosphofructokinase 1